MRAEGFDHERAEAEAKYWSQQEVDRRCAIYGTIAGVVVAGMIVALFWWAIG